VFVSSDLLLLPTRQRCLSLLVPAALSVWQVDEVAGVQYKQAQLDSWTTEQLQQHVAEVALHLQRHRHTHTCAKNGGTQSDKGCRLLMPRPLQQHTELLDVDGVDVLLVRRLAKDLVPYWTFLQLAMPTNMAMYISAEQSRYMRDLGLYENLSPEGQAKTKRPEPRCAFTATYIACLYALKYSTKVDMMAMNERALAAIKVRWCCPFGRPNALR